MGLVHARIFNKLNFEIVGVLTTNKVSGSQAKKKLNDDFGISLKNFVNFDKMLESVNPSCAVICSPPDTHLKYIKKCLKNNLFVFCEKPFFWSENIDTSIIDYELREINLLNKRSIVVNHNNTSFIRKIRQENRLPKKINNFKFSFHTNGNHKGFGIGIDLLPHASSILIDLLGEKNILKLEKQVSKYNFNLNFMYGDTFVEIDFCQNKKIEKQLVFVINDQKFIRVQEGSGDTYKVVIYDKKFEKRYEIEDPFETKIKKFKNLVEGEIKNDEFLESKKIMKLSAKLLAS